GLRTGIELQSCRRGVSLRNAADQLLHLTKGLGGVDPAYRPIAHLQLHVSVQGRKQGGHCHTLAIELGAQSCLAGKPALACEGLHRSEEHTSELQSRENLV